jgi:hypothetical protein
MYSFRGSNRTEQPRYPDISRVRDDLDGSFDLKPRNLGKWSCFETTADGRASNIALVQEAKWAGIVRAALLASGSGG